MTDIATIGEAFATAELWQIIALSLSVSVSAAVIAAVLGLPLGAALAVWRFPGRRAAIVAANSLLGLPPVVIGLALYSSRIPGRSDGWVCCSRRQQW